MDHDRAGGPLAMSSSASASASAASSPHHHNHHNHHHHQPHRQHPQSHHPTAPPAAHRPPPQDYPTTIGSSSRGSGASGSGSNSPSSTLVYEGRSSSSQHPSFDSSMSASRKSSSDLMTRQQQQQAGGEASSSQQRYADYAAGGRPPNGQAGACASYPHASMPQQQHQQQQQQQQQQQLYAAQQQHPSASPSLMSLQHQPVRPPLRSRIFGLGKDLRPQEDLVDPAYFPGGVVPAEAVTLLGTGADAKSKQWPNFSVELRAPTFDERGYPVYSGRAASIKGDIRMRRSDQADVKITISAHTTSGSAAAVWDGVALQPPESGSERTIFQTPETVPFAEGRIETNLQGSQAPSPLSESGEGSDAVHIIPFTLNMPVGGNTRMVDGNTETVAVALPPTFEMSSEQDAREKAVLRNTAGGGSSGSGAGSGGGIMQGSSAASIRTSRTKMTALTIKDAVETGLQQVYRIGCFYRITFSLVRPKESTERDRKISIFSKGKKSGRASGGSSQGSSSSRSSGKPDKADTISIPFVFLGEPTHLPSPPSSLPPLRLSILTTPSVPLARGWESEVVTAKWSGMLLKALKRNVELELFLPEGKVIQAPSVIPVLLVIRPEDPELLPQPSSATSPLLGSPSRSHPGSPRLSSVVSRTDEGTFEQQHPAPPQRSVSGTVPTRSSLASHSFPDVEDEEQEHLDDGGAIGASPSQATNITAPSASTSQTSNSLSRLIRSSLSLSRQPTIDTTAAGTRPSMDSSSGAITPGGSSSAHGPSSPQASQKNLKKKSSRPSFAFHRARPSTAPSTAGSDESRAGTEASFTVRGGAAGGAGSSSSSSGAAVDLPALVRVSLIQNVFYSSSSVNETPKNKKRLVSVADLEGVDFAALVGVPRADGAPANTDAMLQVEEAKRRGVRVLRGLLRVGREATPSFRVQGIELKYAIKVDLLPFNPRPKAARSGGGTASQQQQQQQQQQAGPSGGASSSTSPPRTPPGGASGRPSIHSAYAPSVRGQQQQGQAHNASLSMSSSSSQQWSPSKHQHQHYPHHPHPHQHAPHLPPHLQHQQQGYYDPAAASSAAISSTSGNSGGAASMYGQGGGIAGSEAGWTKRSPSDQTVMGPEMVKLSKTVGALWIGVRMVKGRGAL